MIDAGSAGLTTALGPPYRHLHRPGRPAVCRRQSRQRRPSTRSFRTRHQAPGRQSKDVPHARRAIPPTGNPDASHERHEPERRTARPPPGTDYDERHRAGRTWRWPWPWSAAPYTNHPPLHDSINRWASINAASVLPLPVSSSIMNSAGPAGNSTDRVHSCIGLGVADAPISASYSR